MNRRSFFKSMLGLAGVAAGGAAVMSKASASALPGYHTGGLVRPSYAITGECGPELVRKIKEAWTSPYRYLSYARTLSSMDTYPASLNHTLRDKRFDAVVRNAMRRRVPISPGYREQMVARYLERETEYMRELKLRSEELRHIANPRVVVNHDRSMTFLD